MTDHNDSAELLLKALEDLHDLLDEESADHDLLPEDLTFDLCEEIPVLADRVTLANETPAKATGSDPLTNSEINLIVDAVIEECLPEIEKKLRSRLLDALSL